MKAVDFRAHQHWAFRPGRKLAATAAEVELLQWADRKPARVKIRHLEGEFAQLEEWAKPSGLVCPWKLWPKRLRFEQSELALNEATSVTDHDRVLAQAAETVFGASGETSLWIEERRGYTRGLEPDALTRLAARAGWPDDKHPWTSRPSFQHEGAAYVDNQHLVALARDFAAKNPDLVTLFIDTQEAEWRAAGYADSPFHHRWLIEQSPQHSIARDWAGGAARHHLTDEIRRLHDLLYRALNELRKAGLTQEADRLERAMRSRALPGEQAAGAP